MPTIAGLETLPFKSSRVLMTTCLAFWGRYFSLDAVPFSDELAIFLEIPSVLEVYVDIKLGPGPLLTTIFDLFLLKVIVDIGYFTDSALFLKWDNHFSSLPYNSSLFLNI